MNLQEDKQRLSEAFFAGINACNVQTYGIIKENYEQVRPVFSLVNFIISRLSTVITLAVQDNNWDAEIIYRSALEAIIKFTFIVSASDEIERKQRIKEYWEDLCEINSIKQSEQAKKCLSLYGNDKALRLIFSPMVLPDEEEARLRLKWPRLERKKLEQKWSFSEIIVSLSRSFVDKSGESFIGLGHNYRYASHVTHADETGVLIIEERVQRPDGEREIADFAHYIKLLSDSFQFCAFIGIQVCILVGKDSQFFFDIQKSMSEINELGYLYLQALHKDKAYDKYREKEMVAPPSKLDSFENFKS